MSPEGNDEIVDSVRGEVGGQNDGLVLPLVIPGVPVAAVLAHLSQLQAAERFLLLQEVTQRWAHSYIRRHWWKAFYNAAESNSELTNRCLCYNIMFYIGY